MENDIKKPYKEKTITVNEALHIMIEKDVLMSRMGFILAAERNNFISEIKGVGRETILINVDLFQEWLIKKMAPIPEGYMLIKDAAKKFDFSRTYIFDVIKRHKVETITHGPGKGKMYVNIKALTKVLYTVQKRSPNSVQFEEKSKWIGNPPPTREAALGIKKNKGV